MAMRTLAEFTTRNNEEHIVTEQEGRITLTYTIHGEGRADALQLAFQGGNRVEVKMLDGGWYIITVHLKQA